MSCLGQLSYESRIGDALVDANLVFQDYCLHQWLTNREKAELLWNHYDRDGPRTKNHAEGYYSGLQLAKDSLQEWLDRAPNPPEKYLRARLLRHLDRLIG